LVNNDKFYKIFQRCSIQDFRYETKKMLRLGFFPISRPTPSSFTTAYQRNTQYTQNCTF